MRAFLYLLICVLLPSCAVYRPNTLNVPGHTKKKELTTSLTLGYGINLQGSYSVTSNIGIMANYIGFNESYQLLEFKGVGRSNMFEGGIGYFKNTDSNLRMEVYGGFGSGNVKLNISDPTYRNFSTDANRFFLQPSIGYAKKNFEVFFSTRLSNVNFYNVETDYSLDDLKREKLFNIENKNWQFAEPAITLRGGIKNIKIQAQIGRSFKFNSQKLAYRAEILSLGLFARF
jgi:hypothetical protein